MNILIFRTDKLGDLIISTPVFAAIKARHPKARIGLVASPYNAVAVQGLSTLDDVVLYEKHMDRAQKHGVMQRIKAFKPTHTLVLSPKNNCYFMAWHSGAKKRGGLLMEYRLLPKLLAPILLTHAVPIPRSRIGGHQTDLVLQLAQKMNLVDETASRFPYRIGYDTAAPTRIQLKLLEKNITGPFIAVHLADKWLDDAGWTTGDVARFLIALKQKSGMPIVATTGPADGVLATALEPSIPVLRDLFFAEWAAVFEQSSLVVTPDCGAVHIACALQKSLLALYSPDRFDKAIAEFGPRGTNFRTPTLHAPETTIPLLLDNAMELLHEGGDQLDREPKIYQKAKA